MPDPDRWVVVLKPRRVRLKDGRVVALRPRTYTPDEAERLRSAIPKRAMEHLQHDHIVMEE